MSDQYPADCGQWRKERTKLRGEATDLRAQVARLTEERDELQASRRRMSATIDNLEDIESSLTADRDRLQNECDDRVEIHKALATEHGELKAERDALQERLRDKDALNKALTETAKALRDGEEPYHYCAYCLEKIKTGGDPEHMLNCKKAPYGKLTQMVVDAHDLLQRLHKVTAYNTATRKVYSEVSDYLRTYLECPECGDVAAEGMVSDGDRLKCGCPGIVSVDGETEPSVIEEGEPTPPNGDG